jgi:selenide,water dikinase
MTTLNRAASAAAVEAGPSAMTDVTGFGLLGHLRELTAASGVAACVDSEIVPVIEGALDLIDGNTVSGGSRRNREFIAPFTSFADSVTEERRVLLCDAMTSGGLLVAVDPSRADEMSEVLAAAAPATVRIGLLVDGEPGTIEVR